MITDRNNNVLFIFEGKQFFSHECLLKGFTLKDVQEDMSKVKEYKEKGYKVYYLIVFVHFHANSISNDRKYSELIRKANLSPKLVEQNTQDWITDFFHNEMQYEVENISKIGIGKYKETDISLIIGLIKI